LDALRAAVEADAIVHVGSVDYDVALVDVRDMHTAEVVDDAVISELIAVPVASLVADANVAESIVHAAIEADVSAPIADMEAIAAAIESPVARGP
jgi:hypothetical protein